MLTFVPDFVRSAAAFVVVLGVLVFVHEFGHYLAARWCGVRVETFSIGFGQALTAWTDRRGTIWKLAWLPLGGYVKLHGQENPGDVSPDVRAAWIPGQTFHDKPVLSRAIIVAAGPIANFLLAIVLFAAMFAVVGEPVPLPVIGTVVAHSAAAQAGLKVNDRIVAIDGRPIATFEDLRLAVVAHPADPMQFTITRDGAQQILDVTPEAREADGKRIGLLGVSPGEVAYQRVSPPAALLGGVTQTWTMTRETFSGLA